MVGRYTYLTGDDRERMLATIGIDHEDELFSCVPEEVSLQEPLPFASARSEQEVVGHLGALAERNISSDDEVSFVGAGMYDHYVPAVVEAIASRSEFLTPYTPYQPEVSQGGLQVMFEFQTAIGELTGLPVANASVYDGPSGVGASAYMAQRVTRRARVLVSRGVHPHSREVLVTLARGFGAEIQEIGLDDGATSLAELERRLGDDVAAVIVGQPNFLGVVEDLEPFAERAHAVGALLVCSADPVALSLLRTPGACGADICVGEGQPLGGELQFGGPSFGFFAATERLARAMPGRIAGETVDADGRRAFALVLQTREQHIRREKATSNICTAQAHNALCAMIHLAWLGKVGFCRLGELLVQRTAYLRSELAAIDGVEPATGGHVVREFAVRLSAPVAEVRERCRAAGINPGYALERDYPELGSALLIAVTERRDRAQLDALVQTLATAIAQGGSRQTDDVALAA